MTTDRDRLRATVALLNGAVGAEPDAIWDAAEAWVMAREAEPDKPVQCPCCDKLVTLCIEHYQLHEPGKKCSGCREDE
jgi:hypothetical protein